MDSRPITAGRRRWVLPVLLLSAAVIRLVYLLVYSDMPQWEQLTVDNYYHHHWAETLANGNILGGTTYFRAPLYIFALGLVYSVFGAGLWVARLFGLVVGLASIYCTYRLGRHAFSHHVGLVAAAVQSITPVFLYFEVELLLDMWFTLLLQLSLLAFWRWMEQRTPGRLLAFGLVTGLAAISRPTALVWALLAAIILLCMNGEVMQRLKRVVLFTVGLILVVGPIFVRNLYVADDPVLISSQGGINFYIGNNEVADGTAARLPEPMGHNWRLIQVTTVAEQAAGRELKPGEISGYWTDRALTWMAEHPGAFIAVYFKKLYYGISDHEISNNRDLRRFFADMPMLSYNPVSFAIVLGFALLGALMAWRHGNRRVQLMITLILSHLLTIALFFFASRFRLPLMPYFLVLAAAGALTVLNLFATNTKKGAFALAIVLAVWAFSYYPVVGFPRGAPSQDLASKGIHYYNIGDYETALGYFQAARMLEPTRADNNLNVGACYLRLGIADSAEFYLERERHLHAMRPKAHSNLASLYLISGRYREAWLVADTALDLAPWDVTANMIYLRAAAQDNFTDDRFQTELEEAVQRTRGDLYLLNEAALLSLRRGDTGMAESMFQRALQSRPPPIETDDGAFDRNFPNHYLRRRAEKAGTHYHLGMLAGLAGKYHLAISHNQQAIAADSSLVSAYINLASAYLLTGRTSAADSVLTEAVRRFPDNEIVQRARRQPRP